ncbi:uncharacterized protein VTP21DRAFT_1573 [Calcarisporiella thermophila]|uniref:uncharacterized protein n=1 Tax=Calcarisporiella thermophila TaxID=911321 RepID=UPI0037426558
MSLPTIKFLDAITTNTQAPYDGLLILFTDASRLSGVQYLSASTTLSKHAKHDAAFGKEVLFVADDAFPGGRAVLSGTGGLEGDVDDVRKWLDAAKKAVNRARTAGITRPLLYFPDPPLSLEYPEDYARFLEVSLLGVLGAAFDPVDVREHYALTGKSAFAIEELGVFVEGYTVKNSEQLLQQVQAIEEGKRLAIDLGSPNPERMAPPAFAQYVVEAFKNVSNVNVEVIEDYTVIKREYPLLAAVARASMFVERHRPRVVKLSYRSPAPEKVKENLYFVGKGVTYDTGGADVKYGGVMRGMSRDKCGAASLAGFMKTVSKLAPEHVNIDISLGLVRNSIGADSYVSDEVIVSRAGVRCLVGNTDAEGRMVMGDLLCEAKETALKGNPSTSKLFTVATLTGHAIRAYGPYAAVLENGPARKCGVAKRLFEAGAQWADPFEISTLRREDFALVAPGGRGEDVVQANDKPSTMTSRGHQYPMAFLVVASGLDKHGLDAPKQVRLAYSHLDVAGSAEAGSPGGLSLGTVTGNPVPSLTGAFLL